MTSVYDQVLNAIMSKAQAAVTGMQITQGIIPPDDGIAMMYNYGGSQTTFFSGSSMQLVTIMISGKNQSQEALISALGAIHLAVTNPVDYDDADTYQIFSVVTSSAPTLVAKELSGQWVYSSSLQVKFLIIKEGGIL